jgi:hypothetical protein
MSYTFLVLKIDTLHLQGTAEAKYVSSNLPVSYFFLNLKGHTKIKAFQIYK